MPDFYCYTNLEAQHFFCIEETSANGQQTIFLVNYENLLCRTQFRIHMLNVFAEHVASLLDELLNARDDLNPYSSQLVEPGLYKLEGHSRSDTYISILRAYF